LNAEFNIEPKDDLLMNADEVAAYLKAHPEFFEQYGEVVADLSMPSPHGVSVARSSRVNWLR
jgi:uncharacterized protein YigA (DUF484 family)